MLGISNQLSMDVEIFAGNLLVLSFGPGPALDMHKQSDFLVGKPMKTSSCNKRCGKEMILCLILHQLFLWSGVDFFFFGRDFIR